MEKINNYIIEKLKVNSNTKINKELNLSQKDIDNIENNLCYFFQESDIHSGKKYSNRLEILEKFYDGELYAYLYEHNNAFNDLAKNSNIDIKDFIEYVKQHEEELYNIICNWVL